MMTKDLMKSYETEKSFLENLAKAYTCFNADFIKKFIAEDVTYDSFWVIEQITNKTDYLHYLENKLEAMKNSGASVKFKPVCENRNGKPYLAFTPEKGESSACFSAEAGNSFIKAIHLAPLCFYD